MTPARDVYAAELRRMSENRRSRGEPAETAEVYADDLRQAAETQRRHLRERRRSRDHRGGLFPWAALAIAGSTLAASALIGRRYSPEPAHPEIDRWYHSLDKPSYTPPDAVFGGVWPVLEVLLAAGGYRLMRAEPGRDRDAAIALWLLNAAMVGGWTKIFFSERSLAGGALAAGGLLGAGAAYVKFARRVDPLAAAAGVPYTAWVAFATLLSEEIWRRNPD